MGVLGSVGRSVLAGVKEAPVASALDGALLGQPLVEGGANFVEGLDLFGGHAEEATEERRKSEDLHRMVQAREERLKKLRMVNLQRVAAAYPDVYNQVSAGRRLPRGAVMIGGKPRTDLLAELADSMARGGPAGS